MFEEIEKAEIKARDRWLEDENPEPMSLDQLIKIAVYDGFARCNEGLDCDSKRICGEDECMCVRSIFTAPEYFYLYEELRIIYLKLKTVKELEELK